MTFDVEAIVLILGVVLLLIAIIGGEVEVREFKVPRMGRGARVGAGLLGVFLVLTGIGLIAGPEDGQVDALRVADVPADPMPAYRPESTPVQDVREVSVEDARPQPVAEGFDDAEAPPATGDWRAQLDVLEVMARAEGFALVDRSAGQLVEGGARTVSVRLEAGVRYGIAGVCDGDCSDLDLALLDPQGSVLDSDYLVDDYPMIEITPSYSANYALRVEMARCSIEPCGYVVGLFAQ